MTISGKTDAGQGNLPHRGFLSPMQSRNAGVQSDCRAPKRHIRPASAGFTKMTPKVRDVQRLQRRILLTPQIPIAARASGCPHMQLRSVCPMLGWRRDWLERAVRTTPWLEEDMPRTDAMRSGRRRSGRRRLARLGHAVADAADVEDPGRVGSVVAELGAELLDECADHPPAAVLAPAPDPVQQCFVGHDAARIERQSAQDFALVRSTRVCPAKALVVRLKPFPMMQKNDAANANHETASRQTLETTNNHRFNWKNAPKAKVCVGLRFGRFRLETGPVICLVHRFWRFTSRRRATLTCQSGMSPRAFSGQAARGVTSRSIFRCTFSSAMSRS